MAGYCVSGRHYWLTEDDRQKCCNGYRRVLVLSSDRARRPVGPFRPLVDGAGYRFAWDKTEGK